MPNFDFTELLPLGADDTEYRKLTDEGVSTFEVNGETFLKVEPEALRMLTETATVSYTHLTLPTIYSV